MAKKICWLLPSGRMLSDRKTPELEKKIQEYAEITPRIVYFFV